MHIWRITKYHCDENGVPYGDPFTSICYSYELMETYKNPKYVVSIEEQIDLYKWKTIWSNEELA